MEPLKTKSLRTKLLSRLVFLSVSAWALTNVGISKEISRSEHPRPDFRRTNWLNLNGIWQFCFDPQNQGMDKRWQTSDEKGGNEPTSRASGNRIFTRYITVPFCWESNLSGIKDTSRQKIGWYRRTIGVPDEWNGRHVWICFGAANWQTHVWVNGKLVGTHKGGYIPFEFDISDHVQPGRKATIVIRVYNPNDPEVPIGLQGGDWFTTTSGIWQTAWLESRPEQYIKGLNTIPQCNSPKKWSLAVQLDIAGTDGPVEIEISSPDTTVTKRKANLDLRNGKGELKTVLEVASPKTWSPDHPHLYDLTFRLTSSTGMVDIVHTYFGLRTISRGKYGNLPHESILLNGKPIFLRGVLDKSFNPNGLYTAPSDQFMRHDFEIARSAGFNLVRIHVKAEEPRRLYWADKLGMLIMEDMPCTFRQSSRSRQAWERTMRATIQRDRNHPSIISWCLFNGSWGLGGKNYRTDRDTQSWVSKMWKVVKEELDPSRLVDDNASSSGSHVKTDLNSWSFCIGDCSQARRHIAESVKAIRPGTSQNFVPGHVANGAPSFVSQFGPLSSWGGDRDVSWGLHYLITQLRHQNRIQGYIYAGLTDVEWVHNGIVNYDRSPKEFGYEEFGTGMSLAELGESDFIGTDTSAVIETVPGELVNVPVFVSHFSSNTGLPKLRWQVVGTDDLGRPVQTDPETRPAVWNSFRVTFQKPLPISTRLGRPFVGALILELISEDEKRIGVNYVNMIVRKPATANIQSARPRYGKASPRVEVLSPRLVLVRFDPNDFESFRSDAPSWEWLQRSGKFSACGICEVEYHLALPKFVRDALPTKMVFLAEMATKADGQLIDWPSVRRSLDYPQTQVRKNRGRVGIRLMDEKLWEFGLTNDPSDSRGILSYREDYQPGSYGYLIRKRADLTRHIDLREKLRTDPMFPLVFRTIGKPHGNGLCIFGQDLGRYPLDPMLVIQTARDMAKSVGWTSIQPITVHHFLDRTKLFEGLHTAATGGHAWRYTTKKPKPDWTGEKTDDSTWSSGRAGFGDRSALGVDVATPWNTPDIWLRTHIDVPTKPIAMLLECCYDGSIEIYVNNQKLLHANGSTHGYQQRPMNKSQIGMFKKGRNTIAVHCHRGRREQAVDLGLRWIVVEE